jgi:hypothetical protein
MDFLRDLTERPMEFLRDLTITMVVWALTTALGIVWINFEVPGIWPTWLGPDGF